jgi:hypothetical protein
MAYGIIENNQLIASFVSPLTMRSNQPIFVSDALSLKRTTYKRSPQRWELEAKLEPLNMSANELMVSFITKGFDTVFEITTPQNVGASNSLKMVGELSVATAAIASQSSVNMTCESGSVLPAGTFIKFHNHGKVYMTTETVVFGTGSKSVKIYPPLRYPAAAATIVECSDNVRMQVRYDTDIVRGMVYEDGILMDNGTIRFIEALS